MKFFDLETRFSVAARFVPAMILMSAFATTHAKVDGPVLVDVAVEVPTVIIDMPYASKNNFTGEKLYKRKACLLRPEAARALLDAQYEFMNTGYRLKMLDCYRPKSVTTKMWAFGEEHNEKCLTLGKACKKDNCDPAAPDCLWEPLTLYLSRTSIHSTGAAVDVTLVKNGKELDMGTPFDYFGPEARTKSAMGKQLDNRLFLKEVMERHGFKNYFREWWHYNYVSEGKFPSLDISFTDALKDMREDEKTNEKTR